MLGKRPRPMIGKLSELLVSGKKPGFLDVGTSPRSPLDFKTPSPRGLKRYDVGGVGLGIVAALEKSTTDSGRHAICGSNLSRSNVIFVINSGKNCNNRFKGRYENSEMESSEDFTYVTSHGPGKPSTKVYYDGVAVKETPPPPPPPAARFEEDVTYPTSDFLSCCHLCGKTLHGKDIYMYRGEKGFCSSECRSKQIMMEERKEHCRSEASRSAKVSASPYNNNNNNNNNNNTGQIFFSTGILAI